MSNASRECKPCGFLVLLDDWDAHLEFHDIKNADKVDFSEWCHWIERNADGTDWNDPFDDGIPF